METGVSKQDRREPRTLCSQLDASTSPRGQAVNPIQVGFQFIERDCSGNPFANPTNYFRKSVVGPLVHWSRWVRGAGYFWR